MNARWNRLDIVQAWLQLESDWNSGGWLQERPSNVRRREACSVQVHRMGYSLSLPDRLSANARAIYANAERKLGMRALNDADLSALTLPMLNARLAAGLCTHADAVRACEIWNAVKVSTTARVVDAGTHIQVQA